MSVIEGAGEAPTRTSTRRSRRRWPGQLARVVVTLLAVTVAGFLLTSLIPGDIARSMAGPTAGEDAIAAIRAELRLDDPLLARYWHWLSNAVTGDLGRSFITRQPVVESIVERLPVTVSLFVIAQIMAIVLGFVAGSFAALRPRSLLDRALDASTALILSIPAFVLGLGLVSVFAVRWHVFPAIGYSPIGDGVLPWLRSLVLPATCLALGEAAIYARVLKFELRTVLSEDYITLARAKGFSSSYVLVRHALRPCSLPLVTLIGINAGRVVGGAVVVESLFALPGVGRLTVDSIGGRDYVVVQGIVVVVAASYVIVNVIIDAVYGRLDPRVRSSA
ncbi:MAG TPA: ABC transporter permease [Ilumatobacteraceae bacterium]|nr:ABC transporter permease [Ilumatobacteraceae bacterium]